MIVICLFKRDITLSYTNYPTLSIRTHHPLPYLIGTRWVGRHAGEFAGVRRPDSGKEIEVEGVTVTIRDIVGSTGLELKSDPGEWGSTRPLSPC
eukprot:401675-Prorocentrum_minimum.AAC.1